MRDLQDQKATREMKDLLDRRGLKDQKEQKGRLEILV